MPQNRWALVVGIDKYPHLSPAAQLDGCVRDALAMADMLRERFGFPEANTTVLLDEQATRGAILGALDVLAGRVGEGDALVFHYSGHGSEKPEPAGMAFQPDGLSETLVASDSGRCDPFPNRDVFGHEIHDWLQRVTRVTPYVTLIFDCCHSGASIRNDEHRKVRRVEPDRHIPAKRTLRDAEGGPAAFARYVLLAACRNRQSAYEIDLGGRSHGAMTWHLLDELSKLPPSACPTYRDVFEPVISRVNSRFPLQTPQLEGQRDRELFGLDELTPRSFVPVRERHADRAVLGAGATCGVEERSVWTVHTGGEPAGRLEVVEVRAVTATARILEEVRPGAIERWSRAVCEAGGDGLSRYRKALALRNDLSRLRGKVDFHLARLGNGCWVRVEDGETLAEGMRVSLSVTNHHTEPLHLHVLDFGVTGTISPVYPVRGTSDPLAPGRSIEIGTRPGEEITLHVPEGAPRGEPGEEVLKLFVSTREVDLEPLFQPALRSAARDTRSSWSLDGLPGEDWTTIERRFRLARRVWR